MGEAAHLMELRGGLFLLVETGTTDVGGDAITLVSPTRVTTPLLCPEQNGGGHGRAGRHRKNPWAVGGLKPQTHD